MNKKIIIGLLLLVCKAQAANIAHPIKVGMKIDLNGVLHTIERLTLKNCISRTCNTQTRTDEVTTTTGRFLLERFHSSITTSLTTKCSRLSADHNCTPQGVTLPHYRFSLASSPRAGFEITGLGKACIAAAALAVVGLIVAWRSKAHQNTTTHNTDQNKTAATKPAPQQV